MQSRSSRPFWVFFTLLVVAHFMLHIGLGLGASAPDLLTVAVLVAARRLPGFWAASLGLLLGLLNDSFSIGSFGADAVALTIVGYLGAWSRDLFEGDSLLFVGVYFFLGKWLHDLLFWAFARETVRSGFFEQFLLRSPVAALYAAAAGMVALLIYRATTGDK
jgi:rod shape-determining protein MreD